VLQGAAWPLLIAYKKMQENIKELKTKFIIKREAELHDLEKSQSDHINKIKNHV
jgi:hypothetical protein